MIKRGGLDLVRIVLHIVVCISLATALAARAAEPAAPLTEKKTPTADGSAAKSQATATSPAEAEANADGSTDEQPLRKNAPLTPGTVRRTITRPEMTAEQRKDWADRLREAYSGPSERWPVPFVERSVEWKEIGLLPAVKEPEKGSPEAEKIELGKLLFFDPRISGSGQMSCASCHDPELHWADGRTTGIGNHRKPLRRNTPSLMNIGLATHFFWDGRAGSLDDQARQVLENPNEMDAKDDVLVERLSKSSEYRQRFNKSFGDEAISIDRVAASLAAFEQTIVGGHSAFDAFLRGQREALSNEAVIGLHLFRTEARCMNCHHGPNFTDGKFHDIGLSYYGRELEDLGRYQVTKKAEDVGSFHTPSLRNIANTRPYMHNGLFPLIGVLNMYNAGMPALKRKPQQQDDPLFPIKSHLLQPLQMNSQDLLALKTFLESLSEPQRRVRQPNLPVDD